MGLGGANTCVYIPALVYISPLALLSHNNYYKSFSNFILANRTIGL